jgi:hypothetical protein
MKHKISACVLSAFASVAQGGPLLSPFNHANFVAADTRDFLRTATYIKLEGEDVVQLSSNKIAKPVDLQCFLFRPVHTADQGLNDLVATYTLAQTLGSNAREAVGPTRVALEQQLNFSAQLVRQLCGKKNTP